MYRRTPEVDQNGVVDPKNPVLSGNLALSGTAGMPDQELAVARYVKEHGECTIAKAMELLEVKDRRASTISAASALREETGFFVKNDMERILPAVQIIRL